MYVHTQYMNTNYFHCFADTSVNDDTCSFSLFSRMSGFEPTRLQLTSFTKLSKLLLCICICICVAMYSRTKTDESLILFTLSQKRKRKGQLSCEHISKNYHYQDFKKKKANSNTYLCVPNCYSSDQSNEKHLLHCTFCRSLVLRMSHEQLQSRERILQR